MPHAVFGLLVLLVGGGCERDKDSASAQEAVRPHVLLIVLDTTRVDRLGCYGDTRGLTPNIDDLAASGIRFETAYAHAPWTLPSMASLLTSMYPTVHGAGGRIGQFTPLSEHVTTVAEAFRSAGYRTAEIINVIFLSDKFGMTRGFDHVDFFEETSNEVMRPALETTDAALAWIKANRNKPFFLMVHYFDPHLTYSPPPEFRRRFADERDRDGDDPLFGKRRDMVELRAGRIDLSTLPMDRLEKLYNGEIAYTDQQVGRLLDEIYAMGLGNDVVIALTADHGEEFLDHGGFEHGHTVFEELIRVPLILAGRDVPAGLVARDLVGLIDVAPTLCQLADIEIPKTFRGQTLTPAFESASLLKRAMYSEGNMWDDMWFALREDHYKLVLNPPRVVRLHDLADDPREQDDIKARPDALPIGERMYKDWELLQETMKAQRRAPTAPMNIDPADRERLCALGYVECDEE